MDVRYLAKAESDLRGIADGTGIDWSQPGDIDVPVVISDKEDTQVCKAFVKIKVSYKKKS